MKGNTRPKHQKIFVTSSDKTLMEAKGLLFGSLNLGMIFPEDNKLALIEGNKQPPSRLTPVLTISALKTGTFRK